MDMNDGSADRLTDEWADTQNFRGYNIIPLPLFVAGHKNGVKISRCIYSLSMQLSSWKSKSTFNNADQGQTAFCAVWSA